MLVIRIGRRSLTRILAVAALVLLAACDGSDGGPAGGTQSNVVPAVDDRDPSIARQWSEVLLEAIRGDFARPTVHARNLFHISSAMYDAWAVYSETAETYLLGQDIEGFRCELDGLVMPADIHSATRRGDQLCGPSADPVSLPAVAERARNGRCGRRAARSARLRSGHDSTDYSNGSAAALGNHIAECYIEFGLQDGANEAGFFRNVSYEPVNPVFRPDQPGNGQID